MEDRQINCGDIVRHFKGMLYQVVGIAIHSETREQMIVYQALYGDYSLYVRPKEMFLSEVDHEKYPEVIAEYRFTKIDRESLSSHTSQSVENKAETTQKYETDKIDDNVKKIDVENNGEIKKNSEIKQNNEIKQNSEEVNADLMSFLDAKDYGEKLEVLYNIRKKIDEKMMGDIEMSLDLPVMSGTIEDRIYRIRNSLQTMAKYEGSRLR